MDNAADTKTSESSTNFTTVATGGKPNRAITQVLKQAVSKGASEVKKKTIAVSKGTANVATNVAKGAVTTTTNLTKGAVTTITNHTSLTRKSSSSDNSTELVDTTTTTTTTTPKSNIVGKSTTTTTSPNHNRSRSKEKLPLDVGDSRKKDDTTNDVHSVSEKSTSSEKKTKSKIQRTMSRTVGDFLTEDSIIVLASAIIFALYPTCTNIYAIISNSIPWSVVISWIAVAFALGYALGTSSYLHETPIPGADSLASVAGSFRRGLNIQRNSEISELRTIKEGEEGSHKSRGFLSFLHLRRRGQSEQTGSIPSQISWTSLSHIGGGGGGGGGVTRKRQTWETDVDPMLDPNQSNLMRHLLKFKKLKKTNRSVLMKRMSERIDQSLLTQQSTVDSHDGHYQVGNFSIADATATSFDDDVIEPICLLRGMDIFLTDDAEMEVGTHPWLIQHGLRDVPTFILNFYTQWGNMIMYFALPDFVEDWNLVENETDPDDVKSLKRFLMGDDTYRNLRMKVMPYVVEAPTAVKFFAPAKGKQLTMNSDNVHVSWKKYNKETRSSDGKNLSIAIEAVVDLVTTRMVRSGASLIKGHIQRLLVDAAIIVSTPENQEDEEPMCCLGFFRLNRVNVASCPAMPDRFVEEAAAKKISPALMRASVVLGLKPEDLNKLKTEIAV